MCKWHVVLGLAVDRGPPAWDLTMAPAAGSMGEARGRTVTDRYRGCCPALGPVLGVPHSTFN